MLGIYPPQPNAIAETRLTLVQYNGAVYHVHFPTKMPLVPAKRLGFKNPRTVAGHTTRKVQDTLSEDMHGAVWWVCLGKACATGAVCWAIG